MNTRRAAPVIAASPCAQTPCWPTPAEALGLIEQGHAGRMMADYWVGGIRWTGESDTDYEIEPDITVICPASKGYEGGRAPITHMFGCLFQNEQNLCDIHDSGFKPIEARLAIHRGHKDCDKGIERSVIAGMWETDEGKAVVERWKKEVNF